MFATSLPTSYGPLPAGAVDASWTLAPGPVLMIAVLGGLYVPRWLSVRKADGARAAPAWRLLVFLLGLLCLAAALISPIDALAEQAFSMHMTQHVLLIDIVPICLMLGMTKVLLRPATRRLQALERAVGPLGHPVFALVLYVLVMWVWHVPALYDAALESSSVHVIEHITFLSAGLLYWWHLLSPIRSRLRIGLMGPVVYMLSTKLAVGILGIGLTFTPEPLYDFYEQRDPIWGLSAGGDQELAGAIMALEQSIVMGIALAYLFIRALEQGEREQQRSERLEDLREAQAEAVEAADRR